MSKPKRIFYLGQRGAKTRYGQKAGGLFATLSGMLGRESTMRQQGGDTKMFYADVEWKEYDVDVD